MRPVLAAALFVVSLLTSAVAQTQTPPPLTWSLSVGLNGSLRPGTWAPVIADVENNGPSVRGQLLVPSKAGVSALATTPSGSVAPTSYTLDLDLPAHSRKRFQLCVPSDRLEEVKMALGAPATGREITTRNQVPSGSRLVVVAGGEEGFLRFLSGSTLALGPTVGTTTWQRLECNQVAWDMMPASWLGWDAAEAVVLGDAALSSAPPAAVTALLQWVQTGGTIILPGGETGAALDSTALAPLLPLTGVRTTAVSGVPGLAEWLGKTPPSGPVLRLDGTLRPGAQVWGGTRTQPVILRYRYGSGTVLMPQFDFTVKPFRYWDGQQAFWTRLLAEPMPIQSLRKRLNAGNNSLTQLAATMRESSLPSLLIVGLFLVIYLLVLGPLQYMVLKHLDKRECAWIVTPAIIICFCFGAYLTSVGTRGRQTLAQTISLIETEPEVTAGRVTSWSSLFSPTLSRYEVRFGETVAGVRVFGGAEEGGTVKAGPSLKLSRLPINMWSTRTFGLEALVSLQQGLEVQQCEWDGMSLQVKLGNHTGLRFAETYLVGGGRQVATGNLEPGRTLTGQLTATNGRSLQSPFTHSAPPSPGSSSASGAGARDEAEKLRQQILGLLLASGPGSASSYQYNSAPGPYFVGFATAPAVGLTYDRAVRRKDVTVVVMPLPVRLPPRRVVEVPQWVMQTTSAGEGNNRSSRELLTRYRLPAAPSGWRVVKLKLTVLLPGSGNSIQLYNQTQRQWVQTTRGIFAPQQPQQFFNAAGEALVQTGLSYANLSGSQMTCTVQTN